MAKKKSFRRRPNNSGTVVKLSGNRRNPYMAKITTGYDEISGTQIQKPIGYFKTRQEALDALAIYNLSNKKNIDERHLEALGGGIYEQVMKIKNKSLPSFGDIFEIIFEKDISSLTKSRQKAYKAAYKHLKNIQNIKINEIDLFKMQTCVDIARQKVGSKVLYDMKVLCSKVFEYAVIHQYIDRNKDFTSYIDASKKEDKPAKHHSFTKEELFKIIHDNSDEAKMVMIYIMTGARPVELLNIDKKNIIIGDVSYFKTGSKTKAGRNRIIPIHNYIKPYVIYFKNREQEGFFLNKKSTNTLNYQKTYFDKLMAELDIENHTPYDCRHTFASLAKKYKVDDYSRKKIMGHKSNDLTDDVYTHAYIEDLFNEINKIKIDEFIE